MSLFNIIAIIISITGLFSFINYKFVKLPTTIGLMAIAILFSLFLIFLNAVGVEIRQPAINLLKNIDFTKTLIGGMLSFLLFAGSLHIDLSDLKEQKWVIVVLSIIGTIISTVVVGILMFYVFMWLNINIPLIYCFLFGALISPTDPIAVIAMLKTVKAPKSLQTKIAGESLFNDGVGIVIFLTVAQIISTQNIAPSKVAILFMQEALGGAFMGYIIGWIAYLFINKTSDYFVQVLVTLSVVTGGYALALMLGTSGPIAMVVAGIMVGNHGRKKAMNEESRKYLDIFWEVIDEILNAILFVLIGLEVLVLKFSATVIWAGFIAIAVVLFARWISVLIPIKLFSIYKTFVDRVIWILTWGGLRGGLSVAMALSIPPSPYRDTIITITYLVMAFSVLVQGLTMQTLVVPKAK